MRKTLFALAFVVASGSAMAGPMMCFYGSDGAYSGRDGGTDGVPESQFGEFVDVSAKRGGDDYTWAYVIAGRDTGEECPAAKS